ncbi:MAG: hypothetical protein MI723_12845 [Caulobacterales bacterium]|nr:hypothetical protein [Caulobacterales bacterium]
MRRRTPNTLAVLGPALVASGCVAAAAAAMNAADGSALSMNDVVRTSLDAVAHAWRVD